jgi:hypothetical protein
MSTVSGQPPPLLTRDNRLEVKPETLFSERAVFSEASDRRAKTIAYRRAFEGQ